MHRRRFHLSLACLLGLLLGSPASAAFSTCQVWILSLDSPTAALTYYRQHKLLPQRAQQMHSLLGRLGITTSSTPDEAFNSIYHSSGKLLFRSVRENQVEVLSVSPGFNPQNEEETFLAHPTFPARLAALRAMGGKLFLNPSLHGSGAYCESGIRRIVISPTASRTMFEHEYAHLVDEVSRKGNLDPDTQAEFAPVLDFVEDIRTKTKFSDITLREIFAGLHERRIEAHSSAISPPTRADRYMLSYVWFDLKNRSASSLSPVEQEWKRLAQGSWRRPRGDIRQLARAFIFGSAIGLPVAYVIHQVGNHMEATALKPGFQALQPELVIDSIDRQTYRSFFYIGRPKPVPIEKWLLHGHFVEKDGPRPVVLEVTVTSHPDGKREMLLVTQPETDASRPNSSSFGRTSQYTRGVPSD